MIAAIGNDGWQPVVWGLGETGNRLLVRATRLHALSARLPNTRGSL